MPLFYDVLWEKLSPVCVSVYCFKREPHLSSERSNSSAPRTDACFTQQRPSESYDANVSHFVLHTSSLISPLWGSVQFGQPDTTSQRSDTACRLALQRFFLSPSFTICHSLRHFLSVLFLSPLLRSPFSLRSLVPSPSSFTCFFSPLSSLALFFSVAGGSWSPSWYRCLTLWGPRGHPSWKSPFPPIVQPVGDRDG